MNFEYSRYKLPKEEKPLERFLEIVPGALSWLIIIGMIILSFVRPIAAAVIMIAFLLYWLLRLLYMNIFLVLSYLRLAIEKNTDWMERIKGIDKIDRYLPELCHWSRRNGLRNKFSAWMHCRQVYRLKARASLPPKSEDIYHLLVVPVIREGREIVEPGIRALKEGTYPVKKTLVVIAIEQSASDKITREIMDLQKDYRDSFLDMFVITHPGDIAGEARVKGANITYAAKKAAEYFRQNNIPYENVLVSCFDADTVPSNNYFACLTYHFMISPERTRISYQPVPVYHNNIWEAPVFARIIDIGTSFFQLIEATDTRTLVTFSSHSMSFSALAESDYWPVDMISDDSAIFWKAFIRFDGKYQVVPIYTTVSMDIATGPNILKTFGNIYRQKRRWAWGVENFPVVARAFLKARAIGLWKKIFYGYRLLDSFVSWATWSFLLAFVSWLPAIFSSREFASSTIYYTAPRIRMIIFTLASFGIVICAVISLLLLPKGDKKHSFLVIIRHILEWLFIPVIILFLSALPALDAQTRLMFGRYLEFGVTEKYRQKNNGRG